MSDLNVVHNLSNPKYENITLAVEFLKVDFEQPSQRYEDQTRTAELRCSARHFQRMDFLQNFDDFYKKNVFSAFKLFLTVFSTFLKNCQNYQKWPKMTISRFSKNGRQISQKKYFFKQTQDINRTSKIDRGSIFS